MYTVFLRLCTLVRNVVYAPASVPSGQLALWTAPSMIAGSEWKMSEARDRL